MVVIQYQMGSPENPNKNESNTIQTNTHASMHTVTTEKEAMNLKESKKILHWSIWRKKEKSKMIVIL